MGAIAEAGELPNLLALRGIPNAQTMERFSGHGRVEEKLAQIRLFDDVSGQDAAVRRQDSSAQIGTGVFRILLVVSLEAIGFQARNCLPVAVCHQRTLPSRATDTTFLPPSVQARLS